MNSRVVNVSVGNQIVQLINIDRKRDKVGRVENEATHISKEAVSQGPSQVSDVSEILDGTFCSSVLAKCGMEDEFRSAERFEEDEELSRELAPCRRLQGGYVNANARPRAQEDCEQAAPDNIARASGIW